MEKENFHRVEGERAKSLGKVKTRRSSRSGELLQAWKKKSQRSAIQENLDIRLCSYFDWLKSVWKAIDFLLRGTAFHTALLLLSTATTKLSAEQAAVVHLVNSEAKRNTTKKLAVSEDEVMMPHAFERLWSALDSKGEFQTKITEMVPQTRVVRHLTDRGFQVVAAGTVGGLMRVLFCAKEATSNGTGAWFLAELLQDESDLTLEATFKSKSASAVPGFVQAFMLHHIFTMANA